MSDNIKIKREIPGVYSDNIKIKRGIPEVYSDNIKIKREIPEVYPVRFLPAYLTSRTYYRQRKFSIVELIKVL